MLKRPSSRARFWMRLQAATLGQAIRSRIGRALGGPTKLVRIRFGPQGEYPNIDPDRKNGRASCPHFEKEQWCTPAQGLGDRMKIVAALLSSVIVCSLLAVGAAGAADDPPIWAYPRNNPDYKPPID